MIIDQKQLQTAIRLAQDAFHGGSQVFAAIVDRHHDRNQAIQFRLIQ
jgi:hypothetical protein